MKQNEFKRKWCTLSFLYAIVNFNIFVFVLSLFVLLELNMVKQNDDIKSNLSRLDLRMRAK